MGFNPYSYYADTVIFINTGDCPSLKTRVFWSVLNEKALSKKLADIPVFCGGIQSTHVSTDNSGLHLLQTMTKLFNKSIYLCR